ncbi:MAG TPA: rRNA maturation RNase YbeY [Bacteroidetes bacterium]|jgi:probable rRNA maturation factor|nr:rRNA maturation RNase YbeY [Bacteroidota bacterium]
MLSVMVLNSHRIRRVKAGDIAKYVKRVLRSAGVKSARVSIVCIDSRYSRRINRKYLGHDYATDVLSFPIDTGSVLEGELYVNLDRAGTQAKEYGVSFGCEVARLVIHGVLHLVGFDDATVRKAGRMKTEEDRHVQYWFG